MCEAEYGDVMQSRTDPSSPLPPPPDGARVLVFDSGMGGLTVGQEIAALAPGVTVDYAADTGFFPYGDKSDEALRARLPAVAEALVKAADPDVFVIACNTASTLALPEVRAALDIPVVGTVPAIKPAVAATRTGAIGLLATPGTLSRAYTANLIHQFAPGVTVIPLGSVELVRLAERHAAGEGVPDSDFAGVQAPMFAAPGGERIDTVVLACTHFPLVRGRLVATAPRPVMYIDSGAAIARQTLRVLAARAHDEPGRGARGFITSSAAGQARLVNVLGRYGYGTVREVAVAAAPSLAP